MIKIENFEGLVNSGILYGGHSGGKKGILINHERWLLKYPKSTKSMDRVNLSYTTTPISEYLGSHIYEIIGIDTHETELGIFDNKLVVACKDFLKEEETIFDYNSIKNNYESDVENKLESLTFTGSGDDLKEIIFTMDNNTYFKNYTALKERFWDMFIVDSFINNNDRNEGNWGLIYDKKNRKYRVSPVFDNGAAFYNKADDNKLERLINNDDIFVQTVYHSAVSIFEINEKSINPLKYIEKMDNSDCNQALIRIFPKINMNKIKEMFDNIPKEYEGIVVFSDAQRELYFKMLEYRYNLFKEVYNKLLSN